MQIRRTTSDKRHYHVFLADDPKAPSLDTPVAVTSTDNGHSHNVFVITQADQNGQPTLQFVISDEPSHTHLASPYVPSPHKREKETEEDKVNRVHHYYAESEAREEESRRLGTESEGFYNGKGHWAESTRSKLKKAKRACITINETAAKVDTLTGFQRQNRADIKVRPKRDGSGLMADALTRIIKNITDKSGVARARSFEDIVKVGRGGLWAEMDFDTSFEGEVKVARMPWNEYFLGPHESFMLDDLEYMVTTKMYAKARADRMWPDKANDIHAWVSELDEQIESNSVNENPSTYIGKTPMIDHTRKEIRIFECHHKEFRTEWFARIPTKQMILDLENVKKKDVKKLETIDGVFTQRRVAFDLIHTIVCGKVFIEETVMTEKRFPLSVGYATKLDSGGFQGKIEGIKDPQRSLNKTHSSIQDWNSRMVASKYYVFPESFKGPKERKAFKENASTSGFVAEINNKNDIPVKEDSAPVPAALLTALATNTDTIARVMNIPLEAQGMAASGEVSGRAIMERRRSGLMANEFIFDNFNLCLEQLAWKIIELVKEYYTVPRFLKELDASDMQANMLAIAQIMNTPNWELQYDIKVSQSAESETYQLATAYEVIDLAKQGIMPPQVASIVVTEALPMSESMKKKVTALTQQATQAEQQDKEKTRQTEIVKTQIANKDTGGTNQ